MGFGTTPVSTTPLGTNQFPLSAVAVPGAAGGDLTALEGGPATTDSNGNQTAPAAVYLKQNYCATGTPASVVASTSATQLLTSNANRKAAYLYNESAATLYLGLFAHGLLTTSLYTTQVPPNTLYEMPTSPIYTGEISGRWSSATGNVRITEMS